MEQDAVLCAKFILGMNKDGYYVDPEVLDAAKNILNDYVSENDCYIDDEELDENEWDS